MIGLFNWMPKEKKILWHKVGCSIMKTQNCQV